MAKKAKEKHLQAVEGTDAPVEVEKLQYKMAAVLLIDQEGAITVQDAKQHFNEQIEDELDGNVLNNAIKVIAKNIERAEIVEDVKRSFAASIAGGQQ